MGCPRYGALPFNPGIVNTTPIEPVFLIDDDGNNLLDDDGNFLISD